MMGRLSLITSIVLMWCAAPVVAQEAVARLPQSPTVNTEAITVSLAVYISSLLATAGATWIVARYDSARSAEIKELREAVDRLTKKSSETK